MSVTWQVGDRVYVVAQPEITGTVTEVIPAGVGTQSNGGAENVRVAYDYRPDSEPWDLVTGWYRDAELECYTRPAVDEDETERARR